MKSVSSYYFVFKIMSWAGLMASVASIVISLFFQPSLELTVKPSFAGSYYNDTLVAYNETTIGVMGAMEIKNPTIVQRLFYANDFSEFDSLRNTFWIVLCISIIRLIKDLEQGTTFSHSFSRILRFLGWTLIIFYLVEMLQSAWMAHEVKKLTEGQFRRHKTYHDSLLLVIGVLMIWFSRMHKYAVNLKSEQDLTI